MRLQAGRALASSSPFADHMRPSEGQGQQAHQPLDLLQKVLL